MDRSDCTMTSFTRYSLSISGLLFVAATLLVAGCDDFLTEGPKGEVGGDVVETRNGVNKLLVGAYNALKPFTPPSNGPGGIAGGQAWRVGPAHWPFGAVASDVAQKGSAGFDQSPINALMQHRWTPTNSYFNPLWANRFEGVSRANSVLRTLEKVDGFSENEAARIEGEARFLRAYFYFDLKKNFGNPPLITDTTEDVNQPNNVQEEVVWPQIEEDLEFAMNNLPSTMPDQARANKWAAEAYLAKAHAYQQEWEDAHEHFTSVIENGVTATGVPYELEEQYNYNFNSTRQGADWSEAVFAVEMTGNDGTGTNANSWASYVLNYPHAVSPFACCGFFQPSHDLVNSFKTTSEGLPEPDGFTAAFNGMSEVLKNSQYPTNIASDEQYTPPTNASLDPRLDWTVGRRGVPFMDFGPHPGKRYDRADFDYAGLFHSQKHIWWSRNADTGFNTAGFFPGSGVDYPAMRFADVLLMAAEAEIQSGSGSMQDALDYVNRVRERAANSNGYVKNSHNEAKALAVVGSESAMLNTDPQQYDWVVRTDETATYTFLGGDPSDTSNWNKYPDPTDNYNIDTYTMSEFTSGVGALRKVHFERKLELAMEGHRMYDLWRWGRAQTRMNEYFAYQGELTNDVQTSNTYRGAPYFPIPQNQIDISTVEGEQVLTQNPEY
jgi:hypothetical protein